MPTPPDSMTAAEYRAMLGGGTTKAAPPAPSGDTMTAADYLAMQAAGGVPRANKYGNIPVVIDGVRFDSTGEGQRWTTLQEMEQYGLIRALNRQVRFKLVVNDVEICVYVADFVYEEPGPAGTWVRIVEDYKSSATRTATYKLKKRLMKACKGIEIRETTR